MTRNNNFSGEIIVNFRRFDVLGAASACKLVVYIGNLEQVLSSQSNEVTANT